MYLAHRKIHLRPWDVVDYFERLYPDKKRDYTGTVMVNMNETGGALDSDFDPFPALQLASASPLLSIRFSGPMRTDDSEDLATAFDLAIVASRQPGWAGFIRDATPRTTTSPPSPSHFTSSQEQIPSRAPQRQPTLVNPPTKISIHKSRLPPPHPRKVQTTLHTCQSLRSETAASCP